VTEERPNRKQGPETRKNYPLRDAEGFFKRFMSGSGIDVGYGGGSRETVLESAHGIDKGSPGYDGVHLPYESNTLDYVYNSHCLEHIPNDTLLSTLREWYRVLKVGGHLIICVPHQFLYEKKRTLPSRYNEDHKRFYTPASLMREIEEAYTPNSYRLRHLRDLDTDFDYSIPPEQHSQGAYEIECVIQKISAPTWQV
jgi:SAM-dependent methyltransferase